MKEMIQKIKKRLRYNPNTGVIINVNGRNEGNKVSANGYVHVKIDDTQMAAHRVAFVLMTGEFPDEVDHKNRIKHDNRWCNLRDVSTSVNQLNKPLGKNNTSGYKGVAFKPSKQKWIAQFERVVREIRITWSRSFNTREEAIHARAAELARIGAQPSCWT